MAIRNRLQLLLIGTALLTAGSILLASCSVLLGQNNPATTPEPAATSEPLPATRSARPDPDQNDPTQPVTPDNQPISVDPLNSSLPPISLENIRSLEVMDLYDSQVIYLVELDPNGNFLYVETEAESTIFGGFEYQPIDLGNPLENAAVAFSQDGRFFAIGKNNGQILLYPFPFDTPVTLSAHSDLVLDLQFTHDSQTLISTSLDGKMALWNTETGKGRQILDVRPYTESNSWPADIFIAPDNTRAATFIQAESSLLVWNLSQLPMIGPLTTTSWRDFAGPISSVEIAPDWNTAAWISRGTLQLIDLQSLEPNGPKLNHQDFIMGRQFLANGAQYLIQTTEIISDVFSHVFILYDTQTGEVLQKYSHAEFLSTWQLNPEMTLLAGGTPDGHLLIWDRFSGTLQLDIKAHGGIISGMDFSPDGKLLATSAEDGSLRIWDVQSGEIVFTAATGDPSQSWIKFLGGGRVLGVITSSGKVLFLGVTK